MNTSFTQNVYYCFSLIKLFRILRILLCRYPLIDKGWDLYQGPWCYNSLDYVVYPVGLNLDPDGKHLWLSLGHQDAKGDGWFAKLDIDKLFDSMTNVSQC